MMLSSRSLISAIQAQRWGRPLLLLLDYDGTLVEIAPHPELARPTPEVLELLSRLAVQEDLKVMVVSGRTLRDLQELLPVPGLDFLGSHGGEASIAGCSHPLPVAPSNEAAVAWWRNWIIWRLRPFRGWWIEDKPQGFALHYREVAAEQMYEFTGILSIIQEQWQQEGPLQLLVGKKVLEILPQGVSKGSAIQAILLLAEFCRFFPIYLGDDITDESAFLVVQDRGLSIQVGGPLKRSAATHYLPDPLAVRQFLTWLTFPPEGPGSGSMER
jgi:trehalose 6-phosphate phosphatase